MSGGIQQISLAAKNTSWEALRVGLVAPQDGYVQVWVAKESATNVFFDDISVSATSRYLVEELHYNPWGLELEGLTYSNSEYRYNGKEREARTSFLDYGARRYDKQVGRWWSVDPLAERNHMEGSYVYVHNNPLKYIDPNGKDGVAVIDGKTITIKATYYVEVFNGGFNKEEFEMLQNINKTLNDKCYTITDEKSIYNGFSVIFDLKFFPTTQGENYARHLATTENEPGSKTPAIEQGLAIGNSIITTDDEIFECISSVQDVAKESNTAPYKILGITDETSQHINIPKKSKGNSLTAMHEIFHTLYFDNDAAETGIGSGKELPTSSDMNGLMGGLEKNRRILNSKK